MMRGEPGHCLRQPTARCVSSPILGLCVIQVPITVQTENKWRKGEDKKETELLSAGLCDIIGWRERKQAQRRLLYPLFPSGRTVASGNVLE